MQKKMKAIMAMGPKEMKIVEVPFPERKPGEASLKLKYGGICGTDIKIYAGNYAHIDYPKIIGHEISAEIVEIDRNDKGFTEGMVVTALPYYNCGSCYCCVNGFTNCCMNMATMGSTREGAYSEYICVPAEKLVLPKSLDELELALVEPFAISTHAIQQLHCQDGKKLLIFGSGSIGILALLAARQKNTRVYMADIYDEKLKTAESLGAEGCINLKSGSLAQWAKETTGGIGFDYCLEAAGHAELMKRCWEASAYHGRICLVGIAKEPVDMKTDNFIWKETTWTGSRNSRREDFEDVINAVEGGLDVRKVVSKVYDFQDAETMFTDLFGHYNQYIKTVIKF